MQGYKAKKTQNQLGQTLIETVVAAFILTMGISAAVGLALYAFGTSSNVTKQIIATGLAREGAEAVKNMRDANWLKLTTDSTCYNYATGASDAKCYLQWLAPNGCAGNGNDKGYCMDPANPNGTTYVLSSEFNANRKLWNLNLENSKFGLDFNGQVDDVNFKGFYSPNTSSVVGSSGYFRKITLKKNSNAPYNQNIGPELIVISQVWWMDKRCPVSADWPGQGKCSIEIQSTLTNWKNY
jgi:hypothetical protein